MKTGTLHRATRFIAALVLATTCACAGMLFASQAAMPQAQAATMAYSVSPKINQAALDYMTEMYIQKYPAMGAELMYGSPKDKAVLNKLAGIITSGKSTPEAKCTAIAKWANRNIDYEAMGVSSYPIDVFETRTGNCYGYANLMQQLMRASGVTAVVCAGLAGDTQSKVTLDNVRKGDINGHAWVMAYWSGAWHLYDVLSGFGNYGTASKDALDKNYFTELVEGVTPYYAGMDTSLVNGGNCIYRIGGKMVLYYQGKPCPSNVDLSMSVNGMDIETLLRDRGYGKVGDTRSLHTVRDGMQENELWCDGWVFDTSGDEDAPDARVPLYIRPNGIAAIETFLTYDGTEYYYNYSGQPYTVSVKGSDATLTEGWIELLGGQKLTAKPARSLAEGEYYYWSIFEDASRDYASVTTTGTITAKKTKDRDYASFDVVSYCHDDDLLPIAERSNAYGDFFNVYVSPKAKKFDYTDHNSKANPLKVKSVKRTVKAKKVKSKAVKVKGLTVKKAQGKVTYKRVSGSKKLSVDKKTGKVKVKKGTKKGTYKIKIKVTAAGKGAYKKGAKKGVVTVKVK